MAESEHGVLGERLEGDADEGQEIGDGDGSAFFFGFGAALDERVHGYDEEAAGDAEEREQHGDGGETQARARE